MPAPMVELTDALVEQAMTKGVSEVFATMGGGAKVECLGRTPNPPLHSRPQDISGQHTVASVGFVGDLNGIVNTHFDDEIALDICAKMLGMTPAEVIANEVLPDAMGELTNMMVGVFKNMLCDLGFLCKLTLPSIVRGSDFHVDHGLKSARRFIINFRCRGRAIVTDVIIEQD